MAVAVTRSEATAMCCARRTARGQWGQVGVEKTLICDVAGQRGQRGPRGLARGLGLAGRGDDHRVDEVAELVARRDSVEAEPVVARALHHRGRHLVDAVGLGALPIDGRIQHLDGGPAVGQLGDLPHELLVLATQLPGDQLLREHDELHRSGELLEFLANRGAIAIAEKGHAAGLYRRARARRWSAIAPITRIDQRGAAVRAFRPRWLDVTAVTSVTAVAGHPAARALD